MKISRSLAAVALSGTLLLGGTTIAIAQVPEAADSTEGIGLPATIVVDGVTYFKDTTVEEGKGGYKSADGKKTLTYLEAKAIVDRQKDAEKGSESETSTSETTSAEASASDTTTTTKATEPAGSETSKTSEPKESPTSSSETSSSKPADNSEKSSTSATTTKTAEPSTSKTAEPGDKKSSAEGVLSSKDGKPTPLAIFGIVAGVLAAVAAAFPAIAKALNLNIKLPF